MLLATTSCLQQSDTNNLTSQPCQAQKNPTLQTCLPSRHFTNFPSAPILYSTSASPRGPPRPSRIMSSSALWSAALSSGPEALDGRVLRHLWHCTQAWHRRVTDVTDAHRCAPGLPRNDATHVSRHTRSGPPAPQHINEAWALCTCSTAHAHTPQNHGHVSVSSPLSLEAERPSPGPLHCLHTLNPETQISHTSVFDAKTFAPHSAHVQSPSRGGGPPPPPPPPPPYPPPAEPRTR